MTLSLTPVHRQSPNHKHGYVQLRTPDGKAVNSLYAWQAYSVHQLADLEADGSGHLAIHESRRGGRVLTANPDVAETTDVTSQFSSYYNILRLLPRTGGCPLRRLAPSDVEVLQATAFVHANGSRYVKAAVACGCDVYLVTTAPASASRRQQSKLDNCYVWSTGMHAPPSWWTELKERCQRRT